MLALSRSVSISLATFLVVGALPSQIPAWREGIGATTGTRISYGTRVLPLDPQRVLVAGSFDDGTDESHMWVGLFGAAGQLQWAHLYPGSGTNPRAGLLAVDQVSDVGVDSRGGIIAAGWALEQTTGLDGVLFRLDATGSLQWQANYDSPGSGDDGFRHLLIDNADNTYVVGFGGTSGGLLAKYAPTGTLLWVRSRPGGVYRATLDSAGNLCAVGASAPGSSTATAVWKFDPQGALLWESQIPPAGSGFDLAGFIGVDAADNLYIAGTRYQVRHSLDSDYLVIKVDGSGALQWLRTEDSNAGADRVWGFDVDANGQTVVTGE